MESVPQTLRYCLDCDQSKPLSEFSKCKQRTDGIAFYCRACNAARCKARYQRNPDPYKRKSKMRHELLKHTPEFKASAFRRGKAWAQRNPDKRAAILRAWREAHKEYRRDYCRRWTDANRARLLERYRLRYMAKKQYTVVPFTFEALQEKIRYWGERCWICHCPYSQIDHVKPLNKGGYHILANLRPICRTCNIRKLDHWPIPQIPIRQR